MKSVHSQTKESVTSSTKECLTTEAVAQHKAGKLEAAIEHYLEVIKLADEAPAWIYGNTITLLAKVERYNQAIQLGEQALKIHSQSDEIHRAIGIAADKKHDDHQSIESYRQAVKLNSEQPLWVYYRLIELLTQSQFLDEAIAIGKQGSSAQSRLSLASLLYWGGADCSTGMGTGDRHLSSFIRAQV